MDEEEQLDEQRRAFWDIIKTLHDARALEYVIVIGSWAEYLYQVSNIFKIRTSLRTQDMDLLVPNINRPIERIDLATELQKHGLELRYSPEGFMKFDKTGIIDVEFLVREMSRGQKEPYKVNSLGVTAEGLRNMEILSNNTFTVTVNGFTIIVPRPEAYVLQKLVINQDRKPEYKKEKDIEAVRGVLEAIKQDPVIVARLRDVYNNLTRRQQLKVQNTCQKYNIELPLGTAQEKAASENHQQVD